MSYMLQLLFLVASLLHLVCSFVGNYPAGTSRQYHRQELQDAYDTFGLDGHDVQGGNHVQNEFELLEYAVKGTPEVIPTNWTYAVTGISPLVIDNDDMVIISFNANNPRSTDWIAAYSPANVDPTTTVPVKYGWCNDDPNYLANGSGSLKFNMTNLRADVRFYYYTGAFTHQTYVNKSSNNLTFNNVNEQLRPRVVATGDQNVFRLLWSSASSAQPVMKWSSNEAGVASATAITADTDTIDRSSLCGAPANATGWRDMGLIHSANITGIESMNLANTDIWYTFGDAATNVWSNRTYKFHVPPTRGTNPPNRPTSIIFFDDLGRGSNDEAYTWYNYGEASYNTSKSAGYLISTGAIDAVYHGGDISYAVGYAAVWDFFMDMLVPMAAGVLYFTTVGNHESDWPNSPSYWTGKDSGGECGVTALKMLPQLAPAEINAPWWSYDVGLIHMIGMSTEHDFTIGSPQYKWLESDLASVNRTITPWVIFGGHRPMYIDSSYGPTNSNGDYIPSSDNAVMALMIDNLEPLLWKYKVNVGFYGHMHCVQRQSAVLEGKVVQAAREEGGVAYHNNPQATVQIVIGTGGADLMYATNDVAPDWNEKTYMTWGYAVVEAHNATYLHYRWVQSSDDAIIDQMVLTQEDPGSPATSQSWTCPGDGFSCSATASFNWNGLTPEQIGLVIGGVLIFVGVICILAYKYRVCFKKSKSLKRKNSIVEMRNSMTDVPDKTTMGDSLLSGVISSDDVGV
jgi:hypothetical protein